MGKLTGTAPDKPEHVGIASDPAWRKSHDGRQALRLGVSAILAILDIENWKHLNFYAKSRDYAMHKVVSFEGVCSDTKDRAMVGQSNSDFVKDIKKMSRWDDSPLL